MAITYEWGQHERMHCDKCKVTAKDESELTCQCGSFFFDYGARSIFQKIKLRSTVYISLAPTSLDPKFKVVADV